jgi:hypothetical protein
MALSPAVTHERARIAALSRDRQPDDPKLVEARRNLHAARLKQHIEKTLAAAPPLTDEQRCRLAELLRPVRRLGGDTDAA